MKCYVFIDIDLFESDLREENFGLMAEISWLGKLQGFDEDQ